MLGVSGSGKSTLAGALAADLGAGLVDADDLHPAANIERMRSGTPLTDRQREPWLDEIAAVLAAHRAQGRTLVVACSALRRTYRDRLRAGDPDVVCLLLDGPREEIERRLTERRGHFMPASLLDTQLATLETLEPDESGATLDLRWAPDALVAAARAALQA